MYFLHRILFGLIAGQRLRLKYLFAGIFTLMLFGYSTSLAQGTGTLVSSSASSVSPDSSVSSVPLVFISEILPNPPGSDDDEWIELGNMGTMPVDVGSWTLSASGSKTLFRLAPPGTALLLHPGQYKAFTKLELGLALANKGGTIVLKQGQTVMDRLTYGELPEGISVGRILVQPLDMRNFCIPTKGLPPVDRLPDAGISLQSGEMQGEGSVTVNLEAVLEPSIKSSAECFWDFQDGFSSGSCNPPSHTFSSPGTYTVNLQARDYCGNTVKRSMDFYVYRNSLSSSSSSKNLVALGTPPVSVSRSSSITIGLLSLVRALPNPLGDDHAGEWVELQNGSENDVTLQGWSLRSPSVSTDCPLDLVEMPARGTYRFMVNACSFGLRNEKGGIVLVDSTGTVHSSIEWAKAKDGQTYTPGTAMEQRGLQAVTRVIDGDTIVVGSGRTVRMIGIDAPEMSYDDQPNERYASESSDFLRALIEKKKVELQFDTDTEDAYGRTLAYVHLEDGRDVQEPMLREGYAKAYVRFPFERLEPYQSFEEEARSQNKGMWGESIEGNPSLPLLVTEVYPSPLAGELEWIELYNPNETSVSLKSWVLDDRKGGGSKAWTFPADRMISNKEYVQIFTQDIGLKLNDDGDEVWLMSPDGLHDDHVEVPRGKKGRVVARDPENLDRVCLEIRPTPGEQNICTSVESVVARVTPPRKKIATPPTHIEQETSVLLASLEEQTQDESFTSPSSLNAPRVPFIGVFTLLGVATLGGLTAYVFKRA